MGKCFTRLEEQVYAILNWRVRKTPHDAFVLRRLTPEQERLYQQLKADGRSESAIFNGIFPEKMNAPAWITMDVNSLNKGLLVELIHARVGTPLRTLDKLSVTDLRKLLIGLMK